MAICVWIFIFVLVGVMAGLADRAEVGPGMKLVAVNGRAWKKEWVDAALRAAKTGTAPIELLVESSDYYRTFAVDYHGGPRYPHLERDTAQPANSPARSIPSKGCLHAPEPLTGFYSRSRARAVPPSHGGVQNARVICPS